MTKTQNFKLDVVVPLYNDEEVIETLCETVFNTLQNRFQSIRMILIDDGSADESYSIALRMRGVYNAVDVIKLAGNFGQHRAILAGLRSTSADLVAVMDSDLQDRPEHIPALAERMFEDGTSLAIARRIRRIDSLRKRLFSRLFATTSNLLVPFKVDPHLGAFRVMRQSVVKQICEVKEHTGTPFSMLYSLRVPYSTVDLEREARTAGTTGYTFKKSLKLASDRIMTYSIKPIRLAIVLGIMFGLFSIAIAGYSIVNYILVDRVAPGWTSIVFVTSFFGGLNLLFLGILGEYIGRIYVESRGVPNYIIQETTVKDSDSD
ncbi:MAG: putative glycosyltransferase [Candidatus Poseidoniaceae archaeon]|nr:MAG: putative glycosyltransferase [Candidatus Poseidoniaceae archaeon]